MSSASSSSLPTNTNKNEFPVPEDSSMAGSSAPQSSDFWKISSGPPIPMKRKYGEFNTTYFTLKVCHGGKFKDIPGRTFKRAQVSYVESLNIKRFDINNLRMIAEALGYKTMGKWFFLKEEICSDLEMVEIEGETEIESLIGKIVFKEFNIIEQVYVEHDYPQENVIFPQELMIPASRRIEKIVFLLLVDQPATTVEEALTHVKGVLGMKVPPNKVAKLIVKVRKFLGR